MSRITWNELQEWMVYYSIEPFGEGAENIRFSILCTLFANAFKGKGGKNLRPVDFMKMVEHYEEIKKQTWQEQLEIMKGIAISTSKKKQGKVPSVHQIKKKRKK